MEEVNINDEINQLAGRQYHQKLDWDPIIKDISTSDQSGYLESPAGHGQAIGKEDTFFIAKKLKEHWAEKHPGIKNPKDIVHPDCGCHYSYLEHSK